MKNYGLKSHKLGDKIVLDGIEAINLLQRENKLPGFISGGMAVSSYLPIENHRETIDLDYTLLFGGGVGNYKQISEPLVKSLTEKGYFIEYKKKGTTHDYFIKCKIPTEQDVRNWMTPDKYSLFESFLFKGGGVPLHITKIRGIAEFKKDNYLQMMVDWIIKERVK